MQISELFQGDRYILLDGGMGTMLQSMGLQPGERPELLAVTQPELLSRVHTAYLEAGARVIYANTFGASPHKLEGTGYTPAQLVPAALDIARQAAVPFGALVALDVGPLGELLEPAGTLPFEQAVEQFAAIVKAGADKADLIVIETMTDLAEARAALLAAKENSSLPVLVSMSFEEGGRTFTGCSVEAFAACIGGMGADGLGINCSLGPEQILPMARRLCAAAPAGRLVFVKPNAGLPDPATGEYGLDAQGFLDQMKPYAELGIGAAGGCCGTTPEHIRLLADWLADKTPAVRQVEERSLLTSAVSVVDAADAVVVGERINPTGKKRFQQALREGDMDYILSQAVSQADAGAHMLDVNVGLPDIDEPEMMERTVKALQGVVELPLQLDSTNPAALERGLRVYCGKALVNSVNGEEKSLAAILPLCKKYGAAVIGLTLDENGIPATAEGRLAIARRIVERAAEYGIPPWDIYIDCLTLTASAQQEGAMETLRALSLCKQQLGVRTVLGVSNISFGLPCRQYLNTAFLTMALYAGLDLAIINPNLDAMMAAVASFRVLTCRDKQSADYIARYAGETAAAPQPAGGAMGLAEAIEKGLKAEAAAAARAELAHTQPLDLVNQVLIPALDRVGDRFEKGTLFLPQLLQAAGAAQAAFDLVKDAIAQSGADTVSRGKIVIATVKGDIHDIGKNIVKVILENYGYSVTDLGRDVPPEKVVEAVRATGAPLVGLSALMTTTLPSMRETIRQLRQAGLACKVMVGGAVLTPDYAADMGADFYVRDAKQSADIARQVLEG